MTDSPEQYNVCLVNPAQLPEWFWLPTAHLIQEAGHNYFIPPLPRGTITATVEDSVDVIEETMQDKEQQFIVVLSRGVEFGVRYIDRLVKKRSLANVMGWMVISSVGPRGYTNVESPDDNMPLSRHTSLYSSGVTMQDGLETMDPENAMDCMLHDIDDERLQTITLNNLINERPLSMTEVASVPHLPPNILPLSWYIGLQDRVDNTALSAVVAKQAFGVEPSYTNWGHVGPLSHTEEVFKAILSEAHKARQETI